MSDNRTQDNHDGTSTIYYFGEEYRMYHADAREIWAIADRIYDALWLELDGTPEISTETAMVATMGAVKPITHRLLAERNIGRYAKA